MAKKIPYILDVSRVFIWLSYIPQRFRILVTALVLLIFVFMWRMFIYAPLCEKNLFYQEQLKASARQQEELLRLCNQRKILKEENGKLSAGGIIPHAGGTHTCGTHQCGVIPFASNITDAIVTVANNSSVACSSIVPIKGGFEIGLIGTFHNFVLFLKQLKSVPAALVIKKMECSRMHNRQVCARLEIEFMRY